eukprot:gene21897-28937_t
MPPPPTAEPLADNQKYEKIRDLGSGSFGLVVQARNKITGADVAIKFIERGRVNKYVVAEVLNHRQLCHPRVIQFKEVFLTDDNLGIVMEYAGGGNLIEEVFLTDDNLGIVMEYARGGNLIEFEIVDKKGKTYPQLKICNFGYRLTACQHIDRGRSSLHGTVTVTNTMPSSFTPPSGSLHVSTLTGGALPYMAQSQSTIRYPPASHPLQAHCMSAPNLKGNCMSAPKSKVGTLVYMAQSQSPIPCPPPSRPLQANCMSAPKSKANCMSAPKSKVGTLAYMAQSQSQSPIPCPPPSRPLQANCMSAPKSKVGTLAYMAQSQSQSPIPCPPPSRPLQANCMSAPKSKANCMSAPKSEVGTLAYMAQSQSQSPIPCPPPSRPLQANCMSAPKSKVGTLVYMAPEVINTTTEYDGEAADIWSCGVMLYVTLFRCFPFQGSEQGNQTGHQQQQQHIMKRILAMDWSFLFLVVLVLLGNQTGHQQQQQHIMKRILALDWDVLFLVVLVLLVLVLRC